MVYSSCHDVAVKFFCIAQSSGNALRAIELVPGLLSCRMTSCIVLADTEYKMGPPQLPSGADYGRSFTIVLWSQMLTWQTLSLR